MNIFENPFCILGVSARDNRKRIAEAAEEKSFLNDAKSVSEARSILTNPGRRLAAEIRWFPGMNDIKIREITEFFRRIKAGQNPGRINPSGFGNLTLLNFAVYMFSLRKFRNVSEFAESIFAMCRCFDTVNAERICTEINIDRRAAGFSEADKNDTERELNDYRADILKVIDGRMAALPREKYFELTEKFAAEYSREGGKYYGSFLLADLISLYELKISTRLEELTAGVINADSDSSVSLYFSRIPMLVKEWKRLIRPMMMAAKSLGVENDGIQHQCEEIFDAVRSTAQKLNNQQQKTKEALVLIYFLRESLSDVSAWISEILNDDVRQLEAIERQKNEYESSVYYETNFGRMSEHKLIISAWGISWDGVKVPLEEIYGLAWDRRRSINGGRILTKLVIETAPFTLVLSPEGRQYDDVIHYLWETAAGTISERILNLLRSGETLPFGNILIKDDGFRLNQDGLFSTNYLHQKFTWSDSFKIYSDNGMFFIKSGNCLGASSYIGDMNTHILEAMLQKFLRNPPSKRKRLSSLLNEH